MSVNTTLSGIRNKIMRLSVLLGVGLLLLGASTAEAAYVQVYNTIQKGAVTFTGNTLVLQSTGTSGTAGVYIAAGSTNQVAGYPVGTTTVYTANASRAVLTLPPGATVLHAELVWSGTKGTNTAATINGNVNFTTPSSTYSIASSLTTAQESATYYTRSADVTGLVQIAGSGTYTVGGVPGTLNTAGGSTDAAGWTLAVAYADPAQVARNLTLFVGAELTSGANPTPATVSGFCTPISGPVNGRLAVSAIEGDAAIAGDFMNFGPATPFVAANLLSGPNNLINNFFGGQINGNNGTLDTSGTFGNLNQPVGGNTAGTRQGYDITNVDISTQLRNSQTTAFAQGGSNQDNYQINALGLQINVTTPIFPVSTNIANKAITLVGDTVHYTVVLDNTAGNGAANNVKFFDIVPAGTVFVPNSFSINGVIQPGADPNIGVNIASIPFGSSVSVGFDVNIVAIPSAPAAAKFDNTARWDYVYTACAGVLALPGSVVTNTLSTPAIRLDPVKTVSPAGALAPGQTATYTIAVPNNGLRNTAGTTLTDPIPVGANYVAGSTKLNGVGVADAIGGIMPFATAALLNSPGQVAGVIAVGATATVEFNITSLGGVTIQNVATIDPDGSGVGTSVAISAVNSILVGPTVAKAFLPASIGAGGKSTLTVTLTNANTIAITGVSVTDNLPSGLVIANPANVATTCPGGTASAAPAGINLALSGASIPASGFCTFSADVTAAAAGTYTNIIPAGKVFSNNAGVSVAGTQALTVTAPPSISKAFTPSFVAPNTSVSLTISLTNPTTTAMSNVSVTDIFPNTGSGAPGNMTLFNAITSNTCGGSLTTSSGAALAAGSTSIKLVGGAIPATNVCTITANVTAALGGSYSNTIPAGALSTSGGSNVADASATLQIASPQLSKSFAPAVVGANANSLMTITLANVTGAAITNLAFTDTYPLGLVNANTTVTNTGCGGTAVASSNATNPGTLTFTGGSLAAGATCTLTVNVRSATSGSYTNTIAAGGLTSSIGPNAIAASDTLNVARPNITKAFGATTITLNGTSTLTITLTNPTGATMTGAAFTDTMPTGLTASAAGGTCVGTKTASGNAVSLAGGTIPTGAVGCTVTATVTGTTVGLKLNVIPAGGLTVTSPAGGSNGTSATDDITVIAPPTVSKSFVTSPILPNTGMSQLQIVLTNNNPTDLTGATFIDTFPTTPGAMTLADLSTTNSCSGTLNNNLGTGLAIGSAGIQLTSGVIPANGSCTITVNVKASLAGDYVNTIPASPIAGFLNTTNGGGNTVAATAPLAVRLAAPSVSKSFSPATIVANTSSVMTLTISNPSSIQAITGVAWSDIFPAGMRVFSSPSFTNTCGGTVTVGNVANDTSINLTGATVPFNAAGTGSCSISVAVTSVVTAASPGLNNTTSSVTSNNASQSGVASAFLIVTPAPLQGISGRVFNDIGISGGNANNGLQDGGETGVSGATVKLTDASGAFTYATAVTDSNGNYSLAIPAFLTAGTVLKVVETNLSGFTSTGAQVGNTAGTYAIASDATTFTLAGNASYANVNFADVPGSTLAPNGAQSALPGTAVFYPHIFTAGTAGTVTFSTTNISTPSTAGWNALVYQDANCNGVIDAAEAGALISGPLTVTPGQIICIVVKENIPANAPYNAQDQITISAQFVYANAPALIAPALVRQDLTTIGNATGAGLVLQKSVRNITTGSAFGTSNQGKPNDALEYIVTYSNNSTGTLNSVVINDTTPAFTTFLAATCGAPIACVIAPVPAIGAAGNIQWTLSAPVPAGAAGTVTFTVRIQ
jgi:uncharacterized repeat protein (TIGR01451 family)